MQKKFKNKRAFEKKNQDSSRIIKSSLNNFNNN